VSPRQSRYPTYLSRPTYPFLPSLAALLMLFPLPLTAQTLANPSSTPISTPIPYSLERQAIKAYEEKHYTDSGQLFDTAFLAGLNRSDDAYNAACSYALAGNPLKAFAYLDKALQLGYRDPVRLQNDSDLDSLHSDPKFQTILKTARDNQTSYDRQHHDPDRAAIVTSDIDLFWNAYDKMQTSQHPETVLLDEYFLRGSPGLQDFIFSRIFTAAQFLKAIQTSPSYYAAIRPGTSRIKDFAPQIHATFRKMQELYPDSIFPDVYIVMGRLNTAGTIGNSGLLIAADMFGKAPTVPMDGLTEWHRAAIVPVAEIPDTVAHELVHYQQHTGGKNLLAAAIVEGSADFIGELTSGNSFSNEPQYVYGFAHEAELWNQFSSEMHGDDTSHWLYEGKTLNGRPADMAYFEGYRIAQAYYRNAPDKKKAIYEILNFQDPDKLLNDSGYANQQKSLPPTVAAK
jgi:hypothetical protein